MHGRRIRSFLAAAALLAAAPLGAQTARDAEPLRRMKEFSTLLEQGRLDEAERVGRELDARYGAGKTPWTDSVERLRKSGTDPAEWNAPPSLFVELGDIFDVATMQVPPPSDTPGGLNQRGIALHKAGDPRSAIQAYDASEAGFRRAAQEGGYVAGTGHRYNIHIVVANRAMAYWQLGLLDKALEDVRRALDERAPFEHGTLNPYKSERDMLMRARAQAQELNAIISLERELAAGGASLGLQALLERKGAVLERQATALASVRRNARSQAPAEGFFSLFGSSSTYENMQRAGDRERLAQLQALTSERAQLANMPAATGPEQAARRNRMAELDRQLRDLQGDIQIQSDVRAQAPSAWSTLRDVFSRDVQSGLQRREDARTQAVHTARSALVQQVRDSIPADAFLIEMVRFRSFDPRRPADARWGTERYGAYVLARGAEPAYVDLGEAQAIERLVREFRLALGQDQRNMKDLGRRLDEAVMRPIRKVAGEARTLYLAPEGALNLVPLSALVDEDGRFLVERYTINYLASGRDLLAQAREAPRGPATVIADPRFNLAGANDAAAGGSRSVDFTRIEFTPLPGTAAEAKALSRLLPDAVTITGEQATETAAKRLAGPRILHIATHGFFLDATAAAATPGAAPAPTAAPRAPAQKGSRPAAAGKVPALAAAPLPARVPPPAREPEDPMLRSGLVFAGVNRLRSGDDDGVLTALEAAALDLRGTQLVVLSACETGLGAVRNGEGVFGLRRAFAVAGAETLVMSLWQVADDATMELMAGYYQRLAQGAPRAAALRESQLALLRNPQTASPFYWAAFISSGQAGPLQ